MTNVASVRWKIALLLALATGLSYLDRQSLPVLVSEIQKTIPISDTQYSRLQMAFLLAYGLMYVGGGKIMDHLGTRLGYTIMICWWSAATILHGAVSTVMGLGIGRFLLGLGEGGGFPGSAKAVSEWFPARERAFAFGIFNTGSSAGAVIAPPLIAFIALQLNWRWVFVLIGVLGFIWAVAWWRFYEVPRRHRALTAAERDDVEGSLRAEAPVAGSHERPIRWLELFRYRQTWGLLLAKFLTDAAWYFFIFWLPKYLADVRQLQIKEIGYYAWVPYAFAGVGSLAGGWLSSYLIRRGVTINRSRKISLAISAALMPASLLIATSPLSLAIVFFSLAMLGHQFWSTIVQTSVTDIYPSRIVGSVAGLLGGVGCLGGILFNLLIGALLSQHHGYAVVFLVAGVLHPVSFLVILFVVRRIEPVSELKAPNPLPA